MPAAFRLTPLKQAALSSMVLHDFRQYSDGDLPEQVDPSLTHRNQIIAGDATAFDGLPTHQPDRIDKDGRRRKGRKIRSDARRVAAFVFTLPTECRERDWKEIDPRDRYQAGTEARRLLDQWVDVTMEWVRSQCPGRIAYAVLHLDEPGANPHIHVYVVPENELGHLNYDEHYGGKRTRIDELRASYVVTLNAGMDVQIVENTEEEKAVLRPHYTADWRTRKRAERELNQIQTNQRRRKGDLEKWESNLQKREHAVEITETSLTTRSAALDDREKALKEQKRAQEAQAEQLAEQERRLKGRAERWARNKDRAQQRLDKRWEAGHAVWKAEVEATKKAQQERLDAEQARDQARNAAAQAERAKHQTQAQIATLQQEEQRLNTSLPGLRTEATEVRQQKADAVKERDTVRAQTTTLRENVQTLRGQVNETKTALNGLQGQVTKIKGGITAWEARRDVALNAAAQAESRERLTQAQISTLQRQERELTTTVSKRRETISGLDNKISNRQSTARKLTTEINGLTGTRDGLADQVSEAKATIQRAQELAPKVTKAEATIAAAADLDAREARLTERSKELDARDEALTAREKLWENAQEAPATKALYDRLDQVPTLKKLPPLTGRKEAVNRYIKQEWEGLKAHLENWERAIVAEARTLAKEEDHREVREELAGLKERTKKAEKQWGARLEKAGTALKQTAEVGHRLQQRILEPLPDADRLLMAHKLIQEDGVQSGPAQELVRYERYRLRRERERDQGWGL